MTKEFLQTKLDDFSNLLVYEDRNWETSLIYSLSSWLKNFREKYCNLTELEHWYSVISLMKMVYWRFC